MSLLARSRPLRRTSAQSEHIGCRKVLSQYEGDTRRICACSMAQKVRIEAVDALSHEACQSVHCVARLVTLRRRCVRRARLFRPSLVDWGYSKIADVVQSVRGPLPCMSQAPPGRCTRRAPDSALLCRAPPSRHSAWRVKVIPIASNCKDNACCKSHDTFKLRLEMGSLKFEK